jgi:hypothetical protein
MCGNRHTSSRKRLADYLPPPEGRTPQLCAGLPKIWKRLSRIMVTAAFATWSAPLSAWWDGGHMQIAAIAYSKLTPEAKDRVDALIKLNPDYKTWVGCFPPDQVNKLAFVRASVWADDIKEEPAYTDDGNSPTDSGSYQDKLMHKYWHFMDTAFPTPDDTPTEPADPINALTQIKQFKAALPSSSGVTDDVRSYDLVWVLHLVGDAHQPLHSVSRFSTAFPHGDRGGNSEKVNPASGEVLPLHSYWDRMFGGYSTPQGAVRDADKSGLDNLPVDDNLAAISDPEKWFQESFELAKKFAYAEPVFSGTQPIELTREYETAARNISRSQAALAAQRLANMLNEAFR